MSGSGPEAGASAEALPAARHRVWADIDLHALRANHARIVAALPAGAAVMAIVKADAYGHGAVAVARALSGRPGLWGFGVGDSAEAIELRRAGIADPILILGTIIPEEEADVVREEIRVCVHSMERIETLAAESARQGRRARVHVMVDTGMGRLGALPERALQLALAVARSEHLQLEGLASHVSSARPGHPFTTVQRQRLAGVIEGLAARGVRPPLCHFANTAALLGGVGLDLPLVRPGISLYGMLGPDAAARDPGFQPVLSLRTQIVYLKDVPAETPIGYNGTHVTARPTRIATLPIGYNDGLAYRLSNRGRALVRGRLAPIVGSISMDYTMIDVGAIPGVKVGDTVTLIGKDGEQQLAIGELASLVGTIPYEIACSVGKRVRRVYVEPAPAAAEAAPARPGRRTKRRATARPGADAAAS